MGVVPGSAEVRAGAGSWLKMPKSSSSSPASITAVITVCFCSMRVVALPYELPPTCSLHAGLLHAHRSAAWQWNERVHTLLLQPGFLLLPFVRGIHLQRSFSALFLHDRHRA